MTALHRIDLELGPKVGSGAQGQLYRVEAVRSAIAASLPAPLIFKEFLPGTDVSGVALESLADFRAGLGGRDQEVIDTMTVWPCAVVQDGSARACGYLMRRIPEPFFQAIETTSGSERIPREIQELFVPEPLARKNFGETANGTERLALAREMAYILGFLHKHDVVYGDLSYKNAVFSLRPYPALILLDCDGVRRIGQAAGVAQLHSPGWKPPEGGPQTKGTDRYKLGLFVLRCVTPGVNAQNRDPAKAAGHLDTEGLSLLRRALGDDADRRTTGKEWVSYFNARIAAAGGVRVRTGRAAAPTRPTTRRAPARTWRDGGPVGVGVAVARRPSRGAVAARSYVMTRSGVVPVSSGALGTAAALSSPAPSPSKVWWRTLTVGQPSFTHPHPPIISSSTGLALRLGFAAVGLVVALAIGIFANKPSTTVQSATGAVTTRVGNAAVASASVSSTRPVGTPLTALGQSGELAVSGATKFLNAIDQRAVGLTLPAGSYSTGRAAGGDATPTPWIVQFAAADPDPGSNPATWTIRNVQVAGDSFAELAPTTLTSVAVPMLAPSDLAGLDHGIATVSGVTSTLTTVSWLCNPANSSPACDWRTEDGATIRWFDDVGLPTLPPTWAPPGSG